MYRFGLLGATILSLMLSHPAKASTHHRQSHVHHYSHHYGRYLALRHYHHMHRHWARRLKHLDRPKTYSASLTRAKLPDGQTITVASSFAERFVGFFQDLFFREHKLPEIGCYAPTGHMRNSLHHWGGACDVGQSRRNVAWRPMYAVTDLAHKWGLTDGATWRGNPDAGHVEVNRAQAYVPAVVALILARRPRTYQVARAWPL